MARLKLIGLARKCVSIHCGLARPLLQSINKAELVEPSHKLLSALNYTGVCGIEYLLDPRDGLYRLIEINARTWLWVGLAKACGVDYAKLIYDFVNGREMEYPTNYKVGLNWINPVTDFVFSMISLISGQLKLKAYFYSIFKAQRSMLFLSKRTWSLGMHMC